MAVGAVIAFDQARPSTTSTGTPGLSRSDGWQNRLVTLRCGPQDNTSYAWTLLDVPPGSAATLSSGTAASPTFTPDLLGTYRVRLVVNGGGAGNVQVLVFRVRYDNVGTLLNRGLVLPGYGETAEEDTSTARGYAPIMESLLEDVASSAGSNYHICADVTARDAIPAANRRVGMLVFVITPGVWYQALGGIANGNFTQVLAVSTSVDILPLEHYIPIFSGVASSNSTTPAVLGALYIPAGSFAAPLGYETRFYLEAILDTTNALSSFPNVELFDPDTEYTLPASIITKDSMVGAFFFVSDNITNFIGAEIDYTLDLRFYQDVLDAGTTVYCKSAGLRVKWVAV